MSRAFTFVQSLIVVGILVSGAAIASAAQATYSSLPYVLNNDPSGTDLTTDSADHAADISAAAPVVNGFLNSLSSYGTETYDEYIGGAPAPNLTFGASGITAADTFTAVEGPFDDNTYAYNTNALLAFPGESGNTFLFNTPVTAFGTYIDQAGDADADTLSLLLQNTITMTSETVTIGTSGPDADQYNIYYFGVTDTNPFNEVTVQFSNPEDGVLFDNTTAGFVAVPEPSSLALVVCAALVGLAATCIARRRSAAIA